MTEGELRDPFGEFFVCADASVPIEDLWTRMYSLEVEMVPCFMPMELARKVLLTGKSVNFIRLCCREQDWLPGGAGQPKPGAGGAAHLVADPGSGRGEPDFPAAEADATLASLSSAVEAAALSTNRRLVALMMD